MRTGTLYYLNVHEEGDPDGYSWVHADAQLHQDGLVLVWRTADGMLARVRLSFEFCDGESVMPHAVHVCSSHLSEIRSLSSPTNPSGHDDIGTEAALRQGGELPGFLSPFKLIYDDGVERLGTDSATERGES